MKKFAATLIAAGGLFFPSLTIAQELPPLELYQQMLEMNKSSGWVAFRNYNGQQWIYFTPLVTLHCRLQEVSYSINSDDLDQEFILPRCNPSMPFSVPTDGGVEAIAITLPSGSAQTISVQVRFTGVKTKSDIMTYRPCKDAGDASCAVLVE
ncbi:MAG: hypothetical protein L3J13_06485 [Devosiaceae bacterium]|nr:hypothetical protein [Devosiaceae bacterium]